MSFLILSVVLLLSLSLGLIVANLIVLVLLMEVMLFTFLFMVYDYKVLNYSAACIKYFLVQSMASLMLLLSSLYFMEIDVGMPLWFSFMVYIGLLLKLGAFPLHFWVVPVFKELPFCMLGVLGMFMKVLPLKFLNGVLIFRNTPLHVFNFMMVVGVFSMLTGMVLGLAATNLRAMLGASSITHSGWFFFALHSGNIVEYFLLYSLMLSLLLWSLSYLSSVIVSLSLFGLAGLPPFSVFFAKVLVLSSLCDVNAMLIFVVVALLTSALSLFYYLKYSLYFFLHNNALRALSWSLVFVFFMINIGSAFFLSFSFFFFYGRVWP